MIEPNEWEVYEVQVVQIVGHEVNRAQSYG